MSDASIHEDAFNLLCGKLIGEGIHRKVFECRLREELVVKVEYGTDWRYFANVHEMRFWGDHEHHQPVARWLAPCKYMSPDGRIMLQARVEKVTQAYQLPDKMPSFLTDFKRDNFGWLDGRLVCVDYAMVLTNPSVRLKKVNW